MRCFGLCLVGLFCAAYLQSCKTQVWTVDVQLEDPTWKPVYGEIEFECGHWGVFENAIDMAHIHYLHSDSFGNKVRHAVKPGVGCSRSCELLCC